MNKVSCNIIRDILPLYVDEVVSEDSRDLVETHLAHCTNCYNAYECMKSSVTLPVESSIKPLKHFKTAWLRKKLMIAAISVMLTIFILFAGMMVYQDVGIVHDFFSPVSFVDLRSEHITGQWQRLQIGDSGYLVFDSIFYGKEMILDANCPKAADFRISDESGNVIMDNITLRPGTGASLSVLHRNTNYIVEMKADGDFIFIRFC